MKKHYIGIDLGGSSMKMGLVDASGQVLFEMEQPTPKDAERAMNQMIQSCKTIAKSSDTPWEQIEGIGIGLPGFLDIPNGTIVNLTNLNWINIPIRSFMEEKLQKKVEIDNDANVAALGEAWCGAGKDVDDLICVTLGTGVGGGVIINGKLVYGLKGFAGEIGHIQIDPAGVRCNCKQTGCLETISSATGITRLAREAMAKGESSILTDNPTTYDVFEAAKQQDRVAQRVVKTAIQALAKGFAMISVILNPARFVVGGGVAKAKDSLFVPLREEYRKQALGYTAQDVEIIPALLGNQAGFIGAARLVTYRNN